MIFTPERVAAAAAWHAAAPERERLAELARVAHEAEYGRMRVDFEELGHSWACTRRGEWVAGGCECLRPKSTPVMAWRLRTR